MLHHPQWKSMGQKETIVSFLYKPIEICSYIDAVTSMQLHRCSYIDAVASMQLHRCKVQPMQPLGAIFVRIWRLYVTAGHVIFDMNTLRLWQNGWLWSHNVFNCIFFSENMWISICISLEFVPKGLIDNKPSFIQVAWHQTSIKPFFWTNDD